MVLHLLVRVNKSQDTFTLKPTTYDAVKKEISNLKNDCSTGFDTIPVIKYLKLVSEYIASPIANIINNCIKTNSFPKLRKIARISPIPKIKVPTKPSDYRPISVLPVLSKVFERIILNQVKQFIDKHEVYQYLSFKKRRRREDHRVTTINNEWQWVTTSNNEWQRVTTNDNEWQQMTMSDSEWQKLVQRVKQRSYFKEWMIAIVSIAKIDTLLQWMDGWY